MKPIWYVVGLMLVILGTLVMIAGLLADTNSIGRAVVLANLWWGGLMLVGGSVYLPADRKNKV